MSQDKEGQKPNSGNGGDYPSYRFTQVLGAVDVFVPVPKGTASRVCAVEITSTTIKIGLKGVSPILAGNLYGRVKADDCTWTLVDNATIHVFLEKFDQMKWWPCVVQGEPEVDTKQITPENSRLDDLDSDMRSTVEKMMYDQRQKAAGKPTSDEARNFELLEKFKKSHPEMDFSKAKINYGGSGSGQ